MYSDYPLFVDGFDGGWNDYWKKDEDGELKRM